MRLCGENAFPTFLLDKSISKAILYSMRKKILLGLIVGGLGIACCGCLYAQKEVKLPPIENAEIHYIKNVDLIVEGNGALPGFLYYPIWTESNQIYFLGEEKDTIFIGSYAIKTKELKKIVYSYDFSINYFLVSPDEKFLVFTKSKLPLWYHSSRISTIEKITKMNNTTFYLKDLNNENPSSILFEKDSSISIPVLWVNNENLVFAECKIIYIGGDMEEATMKEVGLKTVLFNMKDGKEKDFHCFGSIPYTYSYNQKVTFLNPEDKTILSLNLENSQVETLSTNLEIEYKYKKLDLNNYNALESRYAYQFKWFHSDTNRTVLTYYDPIISQIVLYNIKSKKKGVFSVKDMGDFSCYEISPDGKRIAFFRQKTNDIEIYIYNWSKEVEQILNKINQ